MRLRVTQTFTDGMTVLHVDGELVDAGARELERVARGVRPLRLDLTHLQRADTAGLAILRQLATAGTELAGVPPYIGLLLERSGDSR